MTTPDETPAVEPVAAEVAETPPPAVPAMEPVAAAPVAPAPQYAAAPYSPPPAAVPQAYANPNPTPNTWMNIVAFVTSLLGLAIVPIIFGHIGVSQANKGRAELKGLGIAGLVIGYITLAFWIVFFAIIMGALIASTPS